MKGHTASRPRLRSPLRRRAHRWFGTTLRAVLLSGVLAATTLVLFTGPAAIAAPDDPSPTPDSESSAPSAPGESTGRPPTAAELKAVEEFWKEQGKVLTKTAQREMLRQRAEKINKLMPENTGQLAVFKIREANNLPLSVYTVSSDTGDVLDWNLGVLNLITELLFLGTKWVIAFACWLLTWALGFGLAKILMAPVLAVANALHTRVIMELGLPTVFLSVCALVCTFRIFFGNRHRGLADAAVSLLLSGLTATLLSSPPQLLLDDQTGALAAARGLSLSIADVIVDAEPDLPDEELPVAGRPARMGHKAGEPPELSPTALARPLTNALAEAFVSTPAQLLQYGQVFEGECAADYTRTRIEQLAYDHEIDKRAAKAKKLSRWLSYDPSGLWNKTTDFYTDLGADFVSDRFGAPPMEDFENKCVKGNLAVAKKASGEKLWCAVFLFLAALIVAALIIWVSATFLAAQARVAIAAITGEAALVAATIPGPGRTWLFDWSSNVLRNLVQLFTSVAFLAIFIVITHHLLKPSSYWEGVDLALRFIVVDIVCIAAFWKRKKITESSRRTAEQVRRRLTSSLIGDRTSANSASAGSRRPVHRRGIAAVGRAAATVGRTAVRAGLVATALYQRDPVAAAGYAMPRTLGAVTLAHRINRRTRRKKPVKAAGRNPQNRPGNGRRGSSRPGQSGGTHRSTTTRQTSRSNAANGQSTTSSTTSKPKNTKSTNTKRTSTQAKAKSTNARRSQPRTPPVQPPASAQQQRLRQRLNRHTPNSRRPRP